MNLNLIYMIGGIFIVIGLLVVIHSCSTLNYQKSDHFNGKEFENPGTKTMIGFKDVVFWQATRKPKKWPKAVEGKNQYMLPSINEKNEFSITYINHATVLIRIQGMNLMTDPVFFDRVGPFSWIGPKRVRKPGIEIKDLPPIHCVLISHNHFDHMDLPSLKALEERDHPIFIVPLGNQKFLMNEGIKNVVEKDWHEVHDLANQVQIRFLPAIHWSGRGITDRMKSLWGSFLISSRQKNVFFAGDSAYGDLFKKIPEQYGKIDVALVPIGAYLPRWFMKHHHMDPQDAVKLHVDLKSQITIPIHYATFNLADEGIEDPVNELLLEMDAKKIHEQEFKILDFGESWIGKF